MTYSDVVARYEEIFAISRAMLTAAKQAEWDQLTHLETQRDGLLDVLVHGNVVGEPDDVQRARQIELIRAILACDNEIRPLVEAWQVELKALLTSLGTERKLHDAYSPSV